jgi:hypothetical protein
MSAGEAGRVQGVSDKCRAYGLSAEAVTVQGE